MFSRLARTRDDALGISRRMARKRSLRRRGANRSSAPWPPRCDDLATWRPSGRRNDR